MLLQKERPPEAEHWLSDLSLIKGTLDLDLLMKPRDPRSAIFLKMWRANTHDVFIGGPTFGPVLNWCMRVSGLRRLLLWVLFDTGIRMPDTLAAWLFGLAIGRKPHRVDRPEE